MPYSETQRPRPYSVGTSGLDSLDLFTSNPVLLGLVAVVAAALRLQFSLSYPDYWADYDLYPVSVQVMASLLVLVSWVAALATLLACFLGKRSSSESFFRCVLTFFFLFIFLFLKLLMPTSTVVAAAKHRTDDLNKLRQIALGILNYESANNHFPSAGNGNGNNGLSWRVHLLPFLECEILYQRFRLHEPWDSPHNIALIDEMPDVHSSRSRAARLEGGKTMFLCPVGNGSVFPADGTPVGFDSIHDGSSNTILLLQVDPAKAVVWTRPADYDFDPADPTRGLGGVHYGGVHYGVQFLAAFCDGSTHQLTVSHQPM